MEVGKAASALAAQVQHTDKPMVFVNIGEPDFTAPPLVQEAAQRAIRDGKTQYTQATGMHALRERISAWYASRFGVQVPARRIVITAGASAALQLACLALIEAGDEVLMPDPSYPCNRYFVGAADGVARLVASTPEERFQLTASQSRGRVEQPHTRGVIGLALQPHRHLHSPRRIAPHSPNSQCPGRGDDDGRDLSGPEPRCHLWPKRLGYRRPDHQYQQL